MKQCLVAFVCTFIFFAGFAHAGDAAAQKAKSDQTGRKDAAAAKEPAKEPAAEKKTAVQIASASDATFKREVLESGAPVIAIFWSPQCGPCDEVAQDLASTVAGKAKLVRINTKMAYRAQAAYHIKEVPVFILFSGGKAHARATGISSKEQILKKLGLN